MFPRGKVKKKSGLVLGSGLYFFLLFFLCLCVCVCVFATLCSVSV